MTKRKWARLRTRELRESQFLTPPDFNRPIRVSDHASSRKLWVYYDKTGQGRLEFYHVESHVWRGGPVDLDAPDWQTAVLTLARLLGWSYGSEDGQMDTG